LVPKKRKKKTVSVTFLQKFSFIKILEKERREKKKKKKGCTDLKNGMFG